MRKGWAPGTTALKSFLKITVPSPLSVRSFLVNNVFNVPVLKTTRLQSNWYYLFNDSDCIEVVSSTKQACSKV
jgi:hypothetical protein